LFSYLEGWGDQSSASAVSDERAAEEESLVVAFSLTLTLVVEAKELVSVAFATTAVIVGTALISFGKLTGTPLSKVASDRNVNPLLTDVLAFRLKKYL